MGRAKTLRSRRCLSSLALPESGDGTAFRGSCVGHRVLLALAGLMVPPATCRGGCRAFAAPHQNSGTRQGAPDRTRHPSQFDRGERSSTSRL
jgi:hypothetical protein